MRLPEIHQILVKVTQEDIDDATHGASDCPLARAIYRAYGDHVFVGRKEVWFQNWGSINHKISDLPEEAVDFNNKFDACKLDDPSDRGSLKPFEFELDVPRLYKVEDFAQQGVQNSLTFRTKDRIL